MIANCKNCGRDTRAVSGYCYRCTSHRGFTGIKGHIHDTKDRKEMPKDRELDFGAAEDMMKGNFDE